MSVFFSNGDIDFSFDKEETINKWIAEIIARHDKKLGKISYLFCSDEMVYDYNLRFLNHDTYTDIITFDYVEGNLISGDIIISIDRVGENANSFSASFESELHRVIIHGVLHLCGINDKGPGEREIMERNENEALALL